MHQTIQFYGLAADVRINDVILVLLTESSTDDTHPLVTHQQQVARPSCTVVLDSLFNDDTCAPHLCLFNGHCTALTLGSSGTVILALLPCRHLSGPDLPWAICQSLNSGGRGLPYTLLLLDQHWLEWDGGFRAREMASGKPPAGRVVISLLLTCAVIRKV